MGTFKIAAENTEKIHFIGIGGSGMSSLAELAFSQGKRVTGSDICESPVTRRLAGKGITVYTRHAAENLGQADAVVYSSAISNDNPEIAEAGRRGIPVLHRSDLLKMMMDARQGITVAGTHGKSTVTAMLATILEAAGESPALAAGAEISGLGSSFLAGNGRFFIAEADESDRSFLKYTPWGGIVTNIDSDHLNNYRDLDELRTAFLTHLNSMDREGITVCCLDDENLRLILPGVERRILTYGLSRDASVRAVDIDRRQMSTSFTVEDQTGRLGRIDLPMPGRANLLNALGAVAFCLKLGIDFATISVALRDFAGLSRRMEFKGEADGILVFDDYAHHPTEIRAAMEALLPMGRRIVLLFQPHRYSRTWHLLAELAGSFQEAGEMLLLPIYPAGEKPGKEDLSLLLAREIEKNRPVTYVKSGGEALARLLKTTIPGDLVVTMGAGDVWKTGEAFLEKKK